LADCLERSSARTLRKYPSPHAGFSVMHILASSMAAVKATSWVWHSARLLYAA